MKNNQIIQGDCLKVMKTFEDKSIDLIVTDPPYGRSSSTKGVPVPELLKTAFKAFSNTLEKGGHVALALPSLDLVKIGTKSMELVETHPYFIHGSLVRHFSVYRLKD